MMFYIYIYDVMYNFYIRNYCVEFQCGVFDFRDDIFFCYFKYYFYICNFEGYFLCLVQYFEIIKYC